jgi:hypothetical protein
MSARRLIVTLFAVEFIVLPSAIGFPDERPDAHGMIPIERICAGMRRANPHNDFNLKTCQNLSAAGMVAPTTRSR